METRANYVDHLNQRRQSRGNSPGVSLSIDSWERNTAIYDFEIRLVSQVNIASGTRRHSLGKSHDLVVVNSVPTSQRAGSGD